MHHGSQMVKDMNSYTNSENILTSIILLVTGNYVFYRNKVFIIQLLRFGSNIIVVCFNKI